MEDESCRRYPGGGIMEEESWRMCPGGAVREEISWRRHHEEDRWRPGTQEAPRWHPGSTQEHPGAPRRHPEGQRYLGDRMCVFVSPAHESDAGNHFRVDGSDVTITVYRGCAQEFTVRGAKSAGHVIPHTEDTPLEPLQQKLLGECIILYDFLC